MELIHQVDRTQAPFTNITLDWVVPSDLAEEDAIIGGKSRFKYKDCQGNGYDKAFLDIMIEGDANGRGFQYLFQHILLQKIWLVRNYK